MMKTLLKKNVKTTFLTMLFCVLGTMKAFSEEPVTEFAYHASFTYEGYEYLVNLSGDVGKALLLGPATTTNQAPGRAASRRAIVFGPITIKGSDFKNPCVTPEENLPYYDEHAHHLIKFNKCVTGNYLQFTTGWIVQAPRRGSADNDEVVIDLDKDYTIELQVIGEDALNGITDLVDVTIPNTVTTIWQGAFANCTNLESVVIPNSVVAIGWGAFSKCSKLKNISIPGSVEHIGENAFIACTSLESATLGEGVKQIEGGVFSECSSLASVSLPSTLEEIGGGAFNQTSNLKQELVLPKNLQSMGEYAFTECGLTELSFAEDAVIETIGKSAFYSCPNLTKITLPSSLKTISANAFEGCSELKEIVLPENLTTIGENAFNGDYQITTVVCRQATPISIPANAFVTEIYTTAKLIVPTGSRALYKAADGWKNFQHIVEMTDESAITMTAKSYTIKYGDTLPAFEFTSEGGTLTGTPSISCEATSDSPVGSYSITIAQGTVTNSNVTYVNGTLTIEKAPLTITAESYTINQGDDLPDFAASYSGFKNNETSSILTTAPVLATTATSTSSPGTYDITVSGAEAENYEISYVNGTLTIEAQNVNPVDNTKEITFGSAVSESSDLTNNVIDDIY